MATVVDPSELRKSSKLKKYLSDVDYKPLPGLEARTGADVMISPDGLLFPKNDALLRHHIKSGSKLLQVKFGHDLAQSITDDRFNEALLRMLQIGAQSWQCLLTFVGTLGMFEDGLAKINGQKTYGVPMKWKQINAALISWSEKGGSLDALVSSGKMLQAHFANHQRRINEIREGKNEKLVWPSQEPIYDKIDKSNLSPIQQWAAAIELKPVNDFRVLLRAIPDVGPERATQIFDWMRLNGKKMSFYGFLKVLGSNELLEVSGIGKGTLENIRKGLNDDAF
jgi:hypothetical protein